MVLGNQYAPWQVRGLFHTRVPSRLLGPTLAHRLVAEKLRQCCVYYPRPRHRTAVCGPARSMSHPARNAQTGSFTSRSSSHPLDSLQGYLFLRRHYPTMPQQHDLGREGALHERPEGIQLHACRLRWTCVKHRTL